MLSSPPKRDGEFDVSSRFADDTYSGFDEIVFAPADAPPPK
jgi:hypothetical protein